MRRKKIIWTLLGLALLFGAWYGYTEFTRGHKDLRRVRPDFVVPAAALVGEFESGDSMASAKYNGKILEVNGTLKSADKDEQGIYTLSLGDPASLSSVRCSVDTLYKHSAAGLKPGSSITIRGACTGYLADEMGLGSDVILNRCIILHSPE